jgi:hypothetical protein
MATRVSIATDDFNRASLGANWLNVNFSASDNITIASSIKFQGNAGSATNPGVAVWQGTGSFTADQYSSARIVDANFGATAYSVGVAARISTDTDANRDYYVHVARSDNQSLILKAVNGTMTTLAGPSAVTWATNDRVEIECEGTTVRAMKNGVALGGVFTLTDASLSTGQPGIAGSQGGGVSTGDDWEGGNLTAGATSWGRLIAQDINRLVTIFGR